MRISSHAQRIGGPVGIGVTLNEGLDIFCHGANRLFGADRTSVWIHDRRSRQLVLQASSDPGHVSRGVRVGTGSASITS